MARVKSGVVTRRRHKKLLKMARGYFGAKSKLYKVAHETVNRALAFAFRDRKQETAGSLLQVSLTLAAEVR